MNYKIIHYACLMFHFGGCGPYKSEIMSVGRIGLHNSLCTDLHEGYTEEHPENFTDAGEDTDIDTDACRCSGIEHGKDDGKTALARTYLHGENVEDVADEAAEAVDDERIEHGGTGDVEGQEDEEELQRGDDAAEGFVEEAPPELARMLVEEADVGIRLLERIIVFLVETAAGAFEPGDVEEDVEEFAEDAVLIAILEEGGNSNKENEINNDERQNPTRQQMMVEDEKGHTAKRPDDEVAVDVHHTVEGNGGDGARSADVFGKFHDAIRTTAEAKRSDGSESEGTHGEFVGLLEGEVLIVVRGVDEHLERPCIECIDDCPRSDDGGEEDEDATSIVAHRLPTVGEAEDHDNDRDDAEDEKDVAIKWFQGNVGGLG